VDPAHQRHPRQGGIAEELLRCLDVGRREALAGLGRSVMIPQISSTRPSKSAVRRSRARSIPISGYAPRPVAVKVVC
jgi:hypothetical protein